MDSGALTILEYCFLALVYLFLFRVVRTVLADGDLIGLAAVAIRFEAS